MPLSKTTHIFQIAFTFCLPICLYNCTEYTCYDVIGLKELVITDAYIASVNLDYWHSIMGEILQQRVIY